MLQLLPIIKVLAASMGNMVNVVDATPTNVRQLRGNRASTDRQQSINYVGCRIL